MDLQKRVWNALNWIKGSLCNYYGDDLNNQRLFEHLPFDEITIWIDFLCIDQAARDLVGELDVLPSILDTAGVHLVLSPSAFTRAWCWEVAFFNRRTANREDRSLISVVPMGSLGYRFWSGVQSTDPADKAAIEERIRTEYPGGFDGFEFIMAESNLIAEQLGAAWTLAAEQQIIQASAKWVPPGVAPKSPLNRPDVRTTRWTAAKIELPKAPQRPD